MGPIEQAIFECSESIHRGDACSECGAEWVDHELLHLTNCRYLLCLNAIALFGHMP